jgi:misacylated tRNA(Ala) deacylase
MPTEALFREDSYLRACEARVLSAAPEAIRLDRTVFYANSGGQPGDVGRLVWEGGESGIVDARKGPEDSVLHIPAPGAALPPAGATVRAEIAWERRHRIMRFHTTLHLVCALLPGIYATGNQIGEDKARIDFDLPEPPAREWFNERLAALVAADHPTGTRWISEAELDAQPALVRTLSVQPPRGAGRIRLVRIGPEPAPVDLQPCGGTHVRSTAEIGRVEVVKMESKGKQNRRLVLAFAEG